MEIIELKGVAPKAYFCSAPKTDTEYDELAVIAETVVLLLSEIEVKGFYPKYEFFNEMYNRGVITLWYACTNYLVPEDETSFLQSMHTVYQEYLGGGGVSFVCGSAYGRSAMAAAVFTEMFFNKSMKESIDYIRELRPGSIDSKVQEDFLDKISKGGLM